MLRWPDLSVDQVSYTTGGDVTERKAITAPALPDYHQHTGPPVDVVESQPDDLTTTKSELAHQDQHGVVTSSHGRLTVT